MKTVSLVMTACIGLLAPGLAFAQNAPYSEPAPTVTPAAANPTGAPLICKYYYYNGRVLPRRDCRTANAWEQERMRLQGDFADYQIRALEQH